MPRQPGPPRDPADPTESGGPIRPAWLAPPELVPDEVRQSFLKTLPDGFELMEVTVHWMSVVQWATSPLCGSPEWWVINVGTYVIALRIEY